MQIQNIDIWHVRKCNECGSSEKLKELLIGFNRIDTIALCKTCREKLLDLLKDDQPNNK